jgi:hypothetical protein
MLMQDPRQGPDSICMFYMQGKCQKVCVSILLFYLN